MSKKNTEELIIEHLSNLEKDEYIHITAVLDNPTALARIVDIIKTKLLNDPKNMTIEQAVQDVELSFYE